MLGHIRANLWLLVLTLLICSVFYPLILLGVGQMIFPDQAQGSLILNKDGQPIGSKIIAQPFTGDEYFHPRPSAVSYNGGGSGASNWGASNPALRKRVVASLGTILKYKDGKPVGPDIVVWFKESLQKDPKVLLEWTKDDATIGERWVSADAANADFTTQWEKEHADQIATWRSENPDAEEGPAPGDVATLFFASYAKGETTTWPETDGKDIQTLFFEVWWQAHSDADVEPVPADMVMASSSGLDPNITLQSALYQLDRVAAKRAEISKRDVAEVRREIESLLNGKASAPLGGLVGVKLVNVLEINLALDNL